jgi:predicted secreted protein
VGSKNPYTRAMRISMRIFCTVVLGLALSVARAGDLPSLEFWGFSSDGKTAAFEQYGERDGSGFPFSTLTVLDVQRNAFIASTSSELETEMAKLPAVRLQSAKKLEGKIKGAGIKRGLMGTLVYQKGQSEGFTYPLLSEALPNQAQFTWNGKTYTLELTPQLISKPTSRCIAFKEYALSLLELKLSSGSSTRTLQKDSKLPASRGCVYDYGISRVYAYRSSLVVFVRTLAPGFEGPDLAWLAVTVKL